MVEVTLLIDGDLASSVKKTCYINENIKIKKVYHSLPFLRSTLKMFMMKNSKNGIHSNQQHNSLCRDKFLMVKKVS